MKQKSVLNGQQVVDALMAREEFDLILMDCHMPVLDGLQAAQIIRKWEKENNLIPVPIVALTASGMEEAELCCITSGMNDFLLKPFNPGDLRAIVEKYVDESRSSFQTDFNTVLSV